MKKGIAIVLVWMMIFVNSMSVFAASSQPSDGGGTVPPYVSEVDARACILMEATTGKVLFEKNADEALPPASVTKVMTMLLVFEAIDGGRLQYTDIVTVSEHAAGMGGSQIFLSPHEKMSVDDLLKGLIVSSANDAAVALAETVGGSEENFVHCMNERARELGMENTHFENTNGLDDTVSNHVISARDIAIATRELLKHPDVLKYTSIWMDTIRDGTFGLSNTNRLIRFYDGATGMKTGSTSKAKFCISATAERNGLSLIAVIMGAPTRDTRNAIATSLFDYAFANYACYVDKEEKVSPIRVMNGREEKVETFHEKFTALVGKGTVSAIEKKVDLEETCHAPLAKGQKLGTVSYFYQNQCIGTADILAMEEVKSNSFGSIFKKLFRYFLMAEKK